MKKITLWTTGFDSITLVGNIKLQAYDPETNDFTLQCQRSGLYCVKPTAKEYIQLSRHDKWDWLGTLPIQEIEIDGITITPTWKPNRYGQPADTNEFQIVEISDDVITLKVIAEGTPEEVFNRYNPYDVVGSNKKKQLKYHQQYLTHDEYLARQKAIKDKLNKTSISKQTRLFD